jgi:hypothetical protein
MYGAAQLAMRQASFLLLESGTVNAEVQTRNVIRVPAKANSIEEWLETYKPLVAAGLPKVEEPN